MLKSKMCCENFQKCSNVLQLKRKTAELTKACEKHYELEQELAFYKIDHKFDQLGKVPSPDTEVSKCERTLPLGKHNK